MGFATVMLGLLVLSACFDVVVPAPVLLGVRLVLAGAGLLTASSLLHPGEEAHLRRTLRPLAPVVLATGLFLLVQLLPIPLISNPVWSSAADALSGTLWGHVTVDVGQTVLALMAVVLAVGVICLAACLSIDRLQAEGMLVGLLAAGVVLPALEQASTLLVRVPEPHRHGAALDGLVLSALVVLAYADLSFERYETRQLGRPGALRRIWAIEAGCLVALLACVAVATLFGGMLVFLAACVGLLTFASLVAARRLGWGGWLTAAVLAAASFAFLSRRISDLRSPESLFLGSAQATGILARMTHDVPFLGTGAGTSQLFGELYRTAGDPPIGPLSSAAAQLRIELGLPTIIVLAALLIWLMVALIRCALTRGRDSIYSILAASVVPALLALAFVNRGVLDWGVVVVAMAVIGLGLSQSISRTAVQR